MNILHLISFYVPAYRYGGPVISTHALNKYLVRQGHKVTVYATNIDGKGTLDVPLCSPGTLDGVTVRYFPCGVMRAWEYSSKLRKELCRTISSFDLVHFTSLFRATGFFGGYYARKNGVPYIISPRGSLMREPLRMKRPFLKRLYISLFERQSLRGASAIHFTSEAERDEYLEARLPLTKGVVVPNSLDTELFQRVPDFGYFRSHFALPLHAPIVLFLSRLTWKKGLDTLIPSFAKVKKEVPDALLVIVGADDEGYQSVVERWVREYHLQDAVRFVGHLEGDLKLAAYRDAQVFTLPSYSENFAMVVTEAMYLGLPVVVTQGVGIASVIQNAQAGVVVEKNEDSVSRVIISLLRDKELAQRLGRNGKTLVEREFSAEATTKRFAEVYNTVKRTKDSF